ncbi:MAG: hypothetical protein J7J15_02450, partial [Candidatus Aenigmarchaeota archaeon]|nr:hypothetical protein [Candidatus Aenigmarchaeota archaeon]
KDRKIRIGNMDLKTVFMILLFLIILRLGWENIFPITINKANIYRKPKSSCSVIVTKGNKILAK